MQRINVIRQLLVDITLQLVHQRTHWRAEVKEVQLPVFCWGLNVTAVFCCILSGKSSMRESNISCVIFRFKDEKIPNFLLRGSNETPQCRR
ncbi:hypothetical protein DPMN_072313 [Dreissena polymorpha]|uniref:Uncharacterized protein n=1 Tax=Dreissena polymorpha TaxID=45954 RepID=A0A9D4BXI0_DREPO|nr:hypothetical protein DPMN_072313 [Dreissena polymorpha]